MLVGTSEAHALTIDTVGTLTADYINENYYRGSGEYLWGQTITAPTAETTLTSFDVFVNSYVSPGANASVTAEFFRWDAASGNPVGQSLWQASVETDPVPSDFGDDPATNVVNAVAKYTPNLNLNPGEMYLFAFYLSGANGLVNAGSTYTEGNGFTKINDPSLSWGAYMWNDLDMPMLVNLSAPAPVPIPAAVWMFGSGLAVLLGLSRRRNSTTELCAHLT